MAELLYKTAGESHGAAVLTFIEGLPAGLEIDLDQVDAELARRQGGYGRSARQQIESDHAEVLAGLYHGRTIGSPLVLQIRNRDARLHDSSATPPISRPRPGHADLAGCVKWETMDCRPILERASARETAGRVAAGVIARIFLSHFGIETFGFVRSVLDVQSDVDVLNPIDQLCAERDSSVMYCPDSDATERMVKAIDEAGRNGDTLGGVVECHVLNSPIGLGSCMSWDQRLDSRIAAAVMGIQAFKGVEIGLGFEAARRAGSNVHDPIGFGFERATNHAGGLEGGMTNGQPIIIRGAMKPISTLKQGLPSVDLKTGEPETSAYERSDVCAVGAASVVMEHVIAFEMARAFRSKFGGDSLSEVRANYESFVGRVGGLFGGKS